MKKTIAVGLLLSLCVGQAAFAAIPYQGKTYEYTQPNGDVITLSLNGNDYFAEQRTTSGRLAIYDNALKGMAYAKVSDDGQSLISTGELVTIQHESLATSMIAGKSTPQKGLDNAVKAKLALANKEKLLTINDPNDSLRTSLASAQKSKAITGKIKGLTVLIQFPDERATMTKQQIEQFLNADNYTAFGNSQSVRGYYRSVSGGKLDYTNTVTTYYTAKHNKSYYTDPSLPFSVRAQELITESLHWLENQQGFDFSTLSTDGNRLIRGLNFMYAGDSESAWSKGLWPHMGGLNPRFCADGVCTNGYQISDMSENMAIGTFAHESGHLLFNWPDLYDYDGSSYGSVASYGIMGYGGVGYKSQYRPTPPVAPLRDLVGWDNVTEINPSVDPNAPQGQLSSRSASNSSFKWTNPNNANEAFYIEAIYQSGQNTEQPGSGLAIFHVDNNANRDNEWHPYIQMEHADGKRDPENNVNQGDATDVYGEYGEFTATLPNALTSKGTNSLWWSGRDSGLNISDISRPAEVISFLSTPNTPPSNTGGNSGNNQGNDNNHTTTTYTGTLSTYQQVVEPYGSYFQFEGNTVVGSLTGPSNADFGLTLYQLVNNEWKVVAQSQNNWTSQESLSYNGGPGYYYFVVSAYYGSGDYQLSISSK